MVARLRVVEAPRRLEPVLPSVDVATALGSIHCLARDGYAINVLHQLRNGLEQAVKEATDDEDQRDLERELLVVGHALAELGEASREEA